MCVRTSYCYNKNYFAYWNKQPRDIRTMKYIFFSCSHVNCCLIQCRNWELSAPWTGAQIKVPTKFIVGELDLTYSIPHTKEYIHGGGFKKNVPFLQDIVVMEGVAHFTMEEKPEEISAHIYNFIEKFK